MAIFYGKIYTWTLKVISALKATVPKMLYTELCSLEADFMYLTFLRGLDHQLKEICAVLTATESPAFDTAAHMT